MTAFDIRPYELAVVRFVHQPRRLTTDDIALLKQIDPRLEDRATRRRAGVPEPPDDPAGDVPASANDLLRLVGLVLSPYVGLQRFHIRQLERRIAALEAKIERDA